MDDLRMPKWLRRMGSAEKAAIA